MKKAFRASKNQRLNMIKGYDQMADTNPDKKALENFKRPAYSIGGDNVESEIKEAKLG